MKKLLLIVVAFILVSIGLTWMWDEWGRTLYGQLFAPVAFKVYALTGFEDVRVYNERARYINVIPFASLVLVTPGIGLRRRALGLLIGLFTLFVSHLLLNLTQLFQTGDELPIVPMILSDAFPFLLWIAVAYPVLIDLLPTASPASTTKSATLAATDDGDGDGDEDEIEA